MDRTTLGDRMKAYESLSDYRLMKRLPVIIRADGNGFSRLTKQMKANKPFDQEFRTIMDDVMLELCRSIAGCVLGYAQSDEISLVVRNDQSLDAEPWFGNRCQKIASIVAGKASAVFTFLLSTSRFASRASIGVFDARAFCVPNLTEAANYLVWRQQDCVRNSIQGSAFHGLAASMGRKTAQKRMHGLDSKQLQELMFQELSVNWNDYDPVFKRGTTVFRRMTEVDTPHGTVDRPKWVVEAAPTFVADEGKAWLYTPDRLGYSEESV